MVTKTKKTKEVLDIGAGDRPIKTTTVAVDINKPTSPPKRVKVIIGKGALPKTGLPLKAGRELKVFYAGNAASLPKAFDNKFDIVHSDSAVGIFPPLSTPKMGKEISNVLKPGGKVKIIANAEPDRNRRGQIAKSEKQIGIVKKMLKGGRITKVQVLGNKARGDLIFVGVKAPIPKIDTPSKKKYSIISVPAKPTKARSFITRTRGRRQSRERSLGADIVVSHGRRHVRLA